MTEKKAPAKPAKNLEAALKTIHDMLKEVAYEQSCRTASGSHWFTNFDHRLQLLEREMGWGPGPKTERPI